VSDAIRTAAQEAEAALRRAGDTRNALAVRKLLASHAALQAQVSSSYRRTENARRRLQLEEYREGAAHV
jgi:hypothetical protein